MSGAGVSAAGGVLVSIRLVDCVMDGRSAPLLLELPAVGCCSSLLGAAVEESTQGEKSAPKRAYRTRSPRRGVTRRRTLDERRPDRHLQLLQQTLHDPDCTVLRECVDESVYRPPSRRTGVQVGEVVRRAGVCDRVVTLLLAANSTS